jgi:hypothetical protein
MTSEVNRHVAYEILSSVLGALPAGRYHVSRILPGVIADPFRVSEAWYQTKSDLSEKRISYDCVSGWFEIF